MMNRSHPLMDQQWHKMMLLSIEPSFIEKVYRSKGLTSATIEKAFYQMEDILRSRPAVKPLLKRRLTPPTTVSNESGPSKSTANVEALRGIDTAADTKGALLHSKLSTTTGNGGTLPDNVTVEATKGEILHSRLTKTTANGGTSSPIVTAPATQCAQLSSKYASAPPKGEAPPNAVSAAARESVQLPPRITSTPAQVAAPPTVVVAGADQSVPLPPKLTSTPTQATGVPTVGMTAAAQSASLPPKLILTPVQATATPTVMAAATQCAPLPPKLKSNPTQATAVPAVGMTATAQSASLPPKLTSTPVQATAAPTVAMAAGTQSMPLPHKLTSTPATAAAAPTFAMAAGTQSMPLSHKLTSTPAKAAAPPTVSIAASTQSMPLPPKLTSNPAMAPAEPTVSIAAGIQSIPLPPRLTSNPALEAAVSTVSIAAAQNVSLPPKLTSSAAVLAATDKGVPSLLKSTSTTTQNSAVPTVVNAAATQNVPFPPKLSIPSAKVAAPPSIPADKGAPSLPKLKSTSTQCKALPSQGALFPVKFTSTSTLSADTPPRFTHALKDSITPSRQDTITVYAGITGTPSKFSTTKDKSLLKEISQEPQPSLITSKSPILAKDTAEQVSNSHEFPVIKISNVTSVVGSIFDPITSELQLMSNRIAKKSTTPRPSKTTGITKHKNPKYNEMELKKKYGIKKCQIVLINYKHYESTKTCGEWKFQSSHTNKKDKKIDKKHKKIKIGDGPSSLSNTSAPEVRSSESVGIGSCKENSPKDGKNNASNNKENIIAGDFVSCDNGAKKLMIPHSQTKRSLDPKSNFSDSEKTLTDDLSQAHVTQPLVYDANVEKYSDKPADETAVGRKLDPTCPNKLPLVDSSQAQETNVSPPIKLSLEAYRGRNVKPCPNSPHNSSHVEGAANVNSSPTNRCIGKTPTSPADELPESQPSSKRKLEALISRESPKKSKIDNFSKKTSWDPRRKLFLAGLSVFDHCLVTPVTSLPVDTTATAELDLSSFELHQLSDRHRRTDQSILKIVEWENYNCLRCKAIFLQQRDWRNHTKLCF